MPPEIKIMCISNVYTRLMHFRNAGDVEHGHTHSYDHGTLVSSGSVLVETIDDDMITVLSQKSFEAPSFVYINKNTRHRLTAIANDTVCVCIHALRTNDEDLLSPDFLIEQLDGDGENIIPKTILAKTGKPWKCVIF